MILSIFGGTLLVKYVKLIINYIEHKVSLDVFSCWYIDDPRAGLELSPAFCKTLFSLFIQDTA